MKVKLFLQQDMTKLEAEINQWLAGNGNVEMKHVQQSYASQGILISIWYDIARRDPAVVPGL